MCLWERTLQRFFLPLIEMLYARALLVTPKLVYTKVARRMTAILFLLPENGVFLLQGERLINTENYKDPEVLRHHLMSLLRDEPRLPRER